MEPLERDGKVNELEIPIRLKKINTCVLICEILGSQHVSKYLLQHTSRAKKVDHID